MKRILIILLILQLFGPSFEEDDFNALLYANPLIHNDDPSQYVNGQIKINGNIYDAFCDCSNDEPGADLDYEIPSECDPSKVKITLDKEGVGATVEEVKNLIGNPSSIPFVKILSNSFYCLDGRIDFPVLGSPGGDAGEFILALSIYQDLLGSTRELDLDSVTTYLKAYLNYMDQEYFVMCTDDEAINHLEAELSIEGLNIHNPRSALVNEVLHGLLQSDNNGDSHIKLLLKYPEMYSIRVDIVKLFLKAFYTIYWDKEDSSSSKLKLEVLVGEHHEGAFVEVRSTVECTELEMAPLITPKGTENNPISVFINHLDAVSVKHYDLAKFFIEYLTHDSPYSVEVFYNRLNHHGLALLEVTGLYTARYLPFMTLELV